MALEQNFFCSVLSREVNENIYGTASIGQVWLLLEYPQPWGLRPLRDIDLANEIKQHLHDALTAIPHSRFLLIKQSPAQNEQITLYVALTREREPVLYKLALNSYSDLLDLNLLQIVAGEFDFGVVQPEQPVFLVCTDGKHDKCCAKFGVSTYAALKSLMGQAAWQSSHVGGDRFAANLLCFPHGVFYGHVEREDVELLVQDYAQGRVRLKNYRGRSCYSFPAQAAEYFVRSQSGITRLDQLFLRQESYLGDNTWQVEFTEAEGRIHRVELKRFKSEFSNYLRCHAAQEEYVNQYELLGYRVSEPMALS